MRFSLEKGPTAYQIDYEPIFVPSASSRSSASATAVIPAKFG
jgi:hypothetical protein